MTIIMFICGLAVRTPTILWFTAMTCDTVMVVSYMLRPTISCATP
jgi:hypothetical protein